MRRSACTAPSLRDVPPTAYSYETAGRLGSVTDGSASQATLTYDQAGNPTGLGVWDKPGEATRRLRAAPYCWPGD
jgi:YD repeat-containing protein